jgi:hypothetical protein
MIEQQPREGMQTIHSGEIRLLGHSFVSSGPRFELRGLPYVRAIVSVAGKRVNLAVHNDNDRCDGAV